MRLVFPDHTEVHSASGTHHTGDATRKRKCGNRKFDFSKLAQSATEQEDEVARSNKEETMATKDAIVTSHMTTYASLR